METTGAIKELKAREQRSFSELKSEMKMNILLNILEKKGPLTYGDFVIEGMQSFVGNLHFDGLLVVLIESGKITVENNLYRVVAPTT